MAFRYSIYVFFGAYALFTLCWMWFLGISPGESPFKISAILGLILSLAFILFRYLEVRSKRSESASWLKASYLGIFSRIVLMIAMIVGVYIVDKTQLFRAALFLSFLYLFLTLLDIFLISRSEQKVG